MFLFLFYQDLIYPNLLLVYSQINVRDVLNGKVFHLGPDSRPHTKNACVCGSCLTLKGCTWTQQLIFYKSASLQR